MAIRNVPPTGSYDGADNSAKRHDNARDGSFAAVYEQARRAALNDNASQDNNARAKKNADNRRYIENLHEKVDTLRGELLVRVIQQAGRTNTGEDLTPVGNDLNRLSNRLDGLRQKLRQEESRLSGKLFDETV